MNFNFGRNFVLMYFFKIILFNLEMYQSIIQSLRTSTLANIWSYLLALTGFLNKYFSKYLGEASIFSKVQANANICWSFLLLMSWKNYLKLLTHIEFQRISRTTTLTHNVWYLHCYEATLLTSVIQKNEIKFSN